MFYFHIVVIFNDYYTLIVAFLTKQIQNRYRYRHLPDTPLRQTSPPHTATAAGGTHPTGMHSCNQFLYDARKIR